MWTLKCMQWHLSPAQGETLLRVCPSLKGRDVYAVLLLQHRLTAWQDHSAHCHCAVYPTLPVSTSTCYFQPVQPNTAHMLLLQLEPVQVHTHRHMEPVPCLMLSDFSSWKQMPLQVPAPLGSCLSGRTPVQMSSAIPQLSEVNIPENTTGSVYKFEIARKTFGPWKSNSLFQLLIASLTANLSIFSHFSHGMSAKGFILPQIFRVVFFPPQYSQPAEQIQIGFPISQLYSQENVIFSPQKKTQDFPLTLSDNSANRVSFVANRQLCFVDLPCASSKAAVLFMLGLDRGRIIVTLVLKICEDTSILQPPYFLFPQKTHI